MTTTHLCGTAESCPACGLPADWDPPHAPGCPVGAELALDELDGLDEAEPITRRDIIRASLRARDVREEQVLRGDVARCRVCGCTDDDCFDCYVRTGAPCCWIEADLCSACAEEAA